MLNHISLRLRRSIAAIASILVFVGTAVAYAGQARADFMDPKVPIPALTWCPGGGGGSAWGGFCEGTSFPDGTRLNFFRAMGFWQGPRCIRPDGTPTPPLAPGGCGGIG